MTWPLKSPFFLGQRDTVYTMRKNSKTTTLRKSPQQRDADDQTIPKLVVRGRAVPLVVIARKNDGPVEWRDLIGRGDEAICDAGYEVILYRDRADAVLCLIRSGQTKQRRRMGSCIVAEWMHNYNIFYIYPTAGEGNRLISHTEKEPMALNRTPTEGTNIRRCVNNAPNDGYACYFPPGLEHTIEEDDPATLMLFELSYGTKRSDYVVQ